MEMAAAKHASGFAFLCYRRSQSSKLLLNDAPGVLGGFDGVEIGGDAELLDVDLRWGLQAVPGGLEDTLLFLGEDRLVVLEGGGFFGWRRRHDCEC